MKFSETSTAKDYGLTVDDVDFEIVEPGNLTTIPTVLIIPHDDEFPIEPFEFASVQGAIDFVEFMKVS